MPGDTEQPGSKSALTAKAGDGFEGGEEGLSGEVFGLLHVTGASQVVAVNARQVAVVELGEGLRVTGGAASQLNIICGRATNSFAVWMWAEEGQYQRKSGEFEHTYPAQEPLRGEYYHMSLHLPKR